MLKKYWLGAALILLGVGATSCSMNSAKRHYVLAEELWTNGKYAASVAEFEKVTAREPSGKLGLQALFRAAMTQTLFLSQYDEAARKFRQYTQVAHEPDTVWEAQKQIGEIYFSKTEQYDQAINHYTELLKKRPDAPEAAEFLFRIGRSQFFIWKFDAALSTYRKLIHDYPKSPLAERSLYEIGVVYFTRGEQDPEARGPESESYQEAMDAFQAFLKAYPKSRWAPEAKFGFASCLEELDQLDAAYHAYESLKNNYPSPEVIAIKLARIHERRAQRSR